MSSAASLATLASEVVEFVLSFHDSVTLARASSSSRALRDAAEAAAARALASRFARAHPDPSVLRRHALWFGERSAGLCTACRGAGWSGCEHCRERVHDVWRVGPLVLRCVIRSAGALGLLDHPSGRGESGPFSVVSVAARAH